MGRKERTDIPRSVKRTVWERDGRRCILCGRPEAGPWCHFIPRSQGGLGIEENIWTGCQRCHSLFDQGSGPAAVQARKAVRAYLAALYPGWNEAYLIYEKG